MLQDRKSARLLLITISLILSFAPISLADDPTGGVYVRDSAVAVEKFALADRMQRLGEWGKAADVYQDLLQSQADRVILSPANPSQYQSVIAAVQDRLCHWPAEGLEVYRSRFETEAAGLLQQALAENRPEGVDDPALLHRIFANYFVTDSGKAAGIRLMDSSIENGEFAAAAWVGQQLLDNHPMLLDDRPRILFREGIAHHLAGDDAAAAAELAEVQQKFPTALGKVAGVDTPLATALADAISHPLEAAVTSTDEDWPMPFGSVDRARLSTSGGFGGARLFGIPIDINIPHGINIPAAARTELKQSAERDRTEGLTLGVLPVIDRDELFFQDNVHLYAVSLESGLPLQGWLETYPSDRNGRYTISGGGWPMPRCEQETTCVTDDCVLAVMGQPDMSAVNLTGKFMRDTRLVCLDRRSGRERWVSTPQRLPAEPATLRELDFGGSPLVVGNNVYLIARGGRGMQFEDCYVICLDLQSGNFKWSSYLASANNTAQMWEMDVAATTGQNVSHIAYSGGRLYVATNVGALAAVDAYSGSVIWLNMYPRADDSQPDRLMGANAWGNRANTNSTDDGEKPWTYNPVIVREGKVFVLPADGTFMHVYDAGSGTELARINLSMRASTDNTAPLETVDTLVGIGGVHGEWAVLASDRSVFCIDWKNYDSNKPGNSLLWASTFAHGGDGGNFPDDSIRGRSFMTNDSVFIPLAWKLVRLSLRNGATQASFPSTGTWDTKDDGPGNVLVTQDHLIIAGAQHVNVYTDISMATRKLDAAVAAAPNDPDQRLRYAEVLSAAGQYDGPDGAAAKLDEAAALLGPAASGQSPLLVENSADAHVNSVTDSGVASPRSRLFNDALTFAAKLQRESPDSAGAMIDGLYNRANNAAATSSEGVTYRLQRAAYLHQKNDAAGELALYQQLLADPQMRSVIVANGDSAASPAGTLAQGAVAEIIQRCGESIYAPYELKAEAAVVSAQALADPSKAVQLVAVAEMYPNAHAATSAMLAAADDFEAAGDPKESAALLRQFCSRYPDSAERFRAIESLARAYLEMPNRTDGLNVAIGRLEQGANLAGAQVGSQKLSRPLKLPDGTQIENVTFAQAADALRTFQAKIATGALPDPRIPYATGRSGAGGSGRGPRPEILPEDHSALLSDVAELVLPLHDWARHDRIVTFSTTRGLGVYAVGASQPVFTCPSVTEAPRNVAWMGGNLLVWCPSQLLLIRGETLAGGATTMPSEVSGTVLWDAPLHTLPAAQFASVGTTTDGNDDSANAAAGDENDPNQPPIDGTVIINGQRIPLRGNGPIFAGNGRVFIGRGGQLQIVGGRMIAPGMIQAGMAGGGAMGGAGAINPGNGQPNGGQPNGGLPNGAADANGENAVEQIDHLVPTGDRLVFSTTGGDAGSRVVCLNIADGRVMWQTSLEDHQIDQLAANDDFVVIRASNDTDIRLVAFDALTGQPVWRPRPFGRENNDTEVPINLCLAEDGSLVYLTSDHICCKDLFDPDTKLRFDREVPSNRNNINGVPNAGVPANTFPGATAPDQLVVSDGRVLAVSDNGSFVRVYSLADGSPFHRGKDGESLLNTEVTDSPWNVHLRVVGTKVYIFGPDKILHYDLDNIDDVWGNDVHQTNGRTQTTVGIRDLIITKQEALLLLEPASVQQRDLAAAPTPVLYLRPYSRELQANGCETASCKIFDHALSDASGIAQIQVVDGGIYFATGDNRLHFLKGGPRDNSGVEAH